VSSNVVNIFARTDLEKSVVKTYRDHITDWCDMPLALELVAMQYMLSITEVYNILKKYRVNIT
jgi:hypothetical protein